VDFDFLRRPEQFADWLDESLRYLLRKGWDIQCVVDFQDEVFEELRVRQPDLQFRNGLVYLEHNRYLESIYGVKNSIGHSGGIRVLRL